MGPVASDALVSVVVSHHPQAGRRLKSGLQPFARSIARGGERPDPGGDAGCEQMGDNPLPTPRLAAGAHFTRTLLSLVLAAYQPRWAPLRWGLLLSWRLFLAAFGRETTETSPSQRLATVNQGPGSVGPSGKPRRAAVRFITVLSAALNPPGYQRRESERPDLVALRARSGGHLSSHPRCCPLGEVPHQVVSQLLRQVGDGGRIAVTADRANVRDVSEASLGCKRRQALPHGTNRVGGRPATERGRSLLPECYSLDARNLDPAGASSQSFAPLEPKTPLAARVFAVVRISAPRSGRLDLNQRPLGPQPSALPDCATPRDRFILG